MRTFTLGMAVLALMGLAALQVPAHGQIAVAPGAGAGVAGFGGLGAGAAAVPAVGGYGLSTVPGGNPYFGGGSLSVSPFSGPYGLSTGPFTGGYIPPYALPYGMWGMGRMDPYSGYLQGLASVTAATGQYQKDIQSARITRYAANSAAIDTARKRIQYEAWFESTRYLNTQALRDRGMAADLDRARKDAPSSEIWSGKALNELLRSIIGSKASLGRGPNLPLDDDTLKHINLSNKASSGNAGMLRDGGKLTWPVGLQDDGFKEPRERLSRKLEEAVESLKAGKDPGATKIKEITADFSTLESKLNDGLNDLRISDYLEAKRYLAQLKNAIYALRDPNVKKYFDNTWNAKGRTVAELVEHMRKEGLSFNGAAPGDESAYTALYHALRAFEGGLMAQR